jgi:hypothetical protein
VETDFYGPISLNGVVLWYFTYRRCIGASRHFDTLITQTVNILQILGTFVTKLFIIRILFNLVYLTALSIPEIIYRRMIGSLVNNELERMWK